MNERINENAKIRQDERNTRGLSSSNTGHGHATLIDRAWPFFCGTDYDLCTHIETGDFRVIFRKLLR